jgi:galactose mutarotase-like enzyme
MPVRTSHDWTFQGFPIVRLENHVLQVDIVPELGGKIIHFTHKGIDRQFLWQNPRQRLRNLPVGAGYDDHFFGGWDELLPNDEAEKVNGEPWADHGELWTCPLETQTCDGGVTLSGRLPINPFSYRRRMWLDEEDATLHMETTVTNTGRETAQFLWKLHPALRISPGAEIIVPARRAIPVDEAFSRFGHMPDFAWPMGKTPDGEVIRADCVPEMDDTTEFLYLVDLEEGVCGLAHKAEDWRFTVTFPKEIFPTVWIFASFGGWRDLETLILEPCTTWPKSVLQAKELERCYQLDSGESVTAMISVHAGAYSEDSED